MLALIIINLFYVKNLDGKFRRYSNRFVYWKANEKEVFALNVVSGTDIDKLFNVSKQSDKLSENDLNKVEQKCGNTRKIKKDELYISVHAAPILSMRHGIVVENLVLTFTKCFLHFQPPDTLEILDENESCMFTTSAVCF